MSQKPTHHPSASLAMLKLRAVLLRTVRQFFDSLDYWEVETPLLSHDVAVDLWLEPFTTSFNNVASSSLSSKNRKPLFLQTSPEFGMKRLLVSGAEAIYQITRSFRNGEVGTLHNPEFTILEWYRVGDNHFDQMHIVEALVRNLFDVTSHWIAEHKGDFATMQNRPALSSEPFRQISYDDAFLQNIGSRVLHLESAELEKLAIAQKINPPESLTKNVTSNNCDEWLNLLLAESIEPHLGKKQPEFLYDYPASQAALSKVRNDHPPVAERFELYLSGIEICNGYNELTDADEFYHRTLKQSELRNQSALPPLPVKNQLLPAMKEGLPSCSGVALGIDRQMMLAVGATDIRDVIAFPFDNA